MKKIIISLLVIVQYQLLTAQTGSVGIGTASPNASAQLDVTSITKGLLIPRMTGAQRGAIGSPASGLIVYQTDGTAGLYMNNGTPVSPVWVYMYTSGSGILTGTGAVTQVAFWNGASTLSSNSNLYWDNTNNRLGIGTAAPAYTLDVTGNWIRVGSFVNTSSTALNFYGVYGSSEVTPNYGFGVRGDGGSVGVYGSADKAGAGPRYGLKGYGKNGTNSNYGVWGSATGGTSAIGVYGTASGGYENWAGFFDGNIKLEAGDMTLNSTTGIINFLAAGVDKGFVQLSGNNLRMGTFSSNTNGKFVVRTGGSDRVYVDGNGNVSVGTANVASGYIFNVGGKGIFEEVKVQLEASWPDYVFEEKYNLMPLNQLETFLNTNKHLPNIPKASEVKKNGIEVGEMERLLTEKVEELTLYIIAMKKEMDVLKTQLQNSVK
ncbi:MAG: hypothetical protein ABIR78_05865 [Ferruginibacter sp.]